MKTQNRRIILVRPENKNDMKTILVTGGYGFIASNFIQALLDTKQYFVINVDRIDYCSNEKNVSRRYNFETKQEEETDLTHYKFIKGDITNHDFMLHTLQEHHVKIIYHFAAQTHVDQSFGNCIKFVIDNIQGTTTLLECARVYGKLEKFIHVSTDEVHGSVSKDDEEVVLKHGIMDPTNPYAATKAAAEFMVISFYRSYNIPVIITRANNIYGPRQYWEKIIPKFVYKLYHNQKCPVYGSGNALRKYLYVDDAIRAFMLVLEKGVVGETYGMHSSEEYSAFNVTKRMIEILKPHSRIDQWMEFVQDRNFHDMRYVVDSTSLTALGWEPETDFETGLLRTIKWYINYAIPYEYWSYDDSQTLSRESSRS